MEEWTHFMLTPLSLIIHKAAKIKIWKTIASPVHLKANWSKNIKQQRISPKPRLVQTHTHNDTNED